MPQLRTAYENFASEALSASKRNQRKFYSNFARAADNAGKYYDLTVDLKGLAENTADILPQSAPALKQAIEAAVVANSHGPKASKSSGLSTCYPFQIGKERFKAYNSQNSVPQNMKKSY